MENVKVRTADGKIRNECIYNIHDFPYDSINCIRVWSKNFINTMKSFGTFDIETTSIKNNEYKYGFMYLWQFCIDNYVVMGRTWDEYMEFINNLKSKFRLSKKKHFVVYVHNLSFEFQFISRFFQWENIFAKEPRKVLRCVDKNGIEYRCSYYLTNMSLEKACENTPNCLYYKKDGNEYDYKKLRSPSTILNNTELEYGYCDVRGLHEVIEHKLKDDTLVSIPMTSTGYVRRDCRNAMRKNPKNRKLFLKTQIDEKIYTLIQEAKRGGNTHGNRILVGKILENLRSFDVVSSYPFAMMVRYFPVSCFMHISMIENEKEFKQYLNEYCCLFRVTFINLRLKNDNVPIPYIAYHKLNEHSGKKDIVFNGRLLYSPACTMTLTEIDFKIIEDQYKWDDIGVSDFYIAERGELPEELKEQIRKYFYNKTTLKNSDYYNYMKSKNLLNAIFGMMCTDPVHDSIVYNGTWDKEPGSIAHELEKYYKSRNSFLPIQWGIWVTAHSRAWLQEAINLTGVNTVYVDTDNDKAINVTDGLFEGLNRQAIELCEKYGAYADYDGERYYMGVFEEEKPYKYFVTWGAKKYVYQNIWDNKTPDKEEIEENNLLKVKDHFEDVHITIAGVHKYLGAKYLRDIGGIKEFKLGMCFHGQSKGGGTESVWNDEDIHYINVNGEKIKTAANVGIFDSDYTLGVNDGFIENKDFNIDVFMRM